MVEENKYIIKFDKSTQIGASILGFSKVLMNYFHSTYFIKNKCGDKSKLLFTDTNSLMCEIKT